MMKSILSRLTIHKPSNRLYHDTLKLLSRQCKIETISKFSFSTSSPSPSPSPSENRSVSILGDELQEEYSVDRSSTSLSPDEFVGVRGHSSVIDKADFAHARIGDVLEIPYEVTASDFWRV